MEIGDVGFDGLGWGSWEEEEDSLFEKSSPLTEIFKRGVEFNERYTSSTKTKFKQLSKRSFLVAAGGTWSASASSSKDNNGNSKTTAEVSIGKETESGINISANAGGCISTTKDQNIQERAHGSFSIEKETESGINISISAGGCISKDRNQNVQTSVEGSVKLKGKF